VFSNTDSKGPLLGQEQQVKKWSFKSGTKEEWDSEKTKFTGVFNTVFKNEKISKGVSPVRNVFRMVCCRGWSKGGGGQSFTLEGGDVAPFATVLGKVGRVGGAWGKTEKVLGGQKTVGVTGKRHG